MVGILTRSWQNTKYSGLGTEKFRLIDTMGGVVFDSVMSSPDSVIQNTQPNYKNGTLGTGVHFDFFFCGSIS